MLYRVIRYGLAVLLVSVFYRKLDMLLIPACFVLVTGIGGWLGYQQSGFPAIETGIALSLLQVFTLWVSYSVSCCISLGGDTPCLRFMRG